MMDLAIPCTIGVVEQISSTTNNTTINNSVGLLSPTTMAAARTLSSPPTLIKDLSPMVIDKKRRLSNPPKPVVNFNGFKHFVRHVRNNSRVLDEETVPEEPTEVVPLTTVKKMPTVRSNNKIFSFTHSILVLYGVMLALSLFSIISALIILD